MSDDQRYVIASKNVHCQKFDGEVIVLDTKSGLYFSLRESAVDIWTLVEAGASRRAIVNSLVARYAGERVEIEAAVDRALELLLKDHVIRKTAESGASDPQPVGDPNRKPFVDPSVERFTDMQNLLLLDPIHEVTEEGWPLQPEAASRE